MTTIAQFVIRVLRKLQSRTSSADHLQLGRIGETEAYFYLKQHGYRIVATNFRAPHDRGEIDLIGWDGDVLCFIEVKTRTDVSFAPPSTAVTPEKQSHILSVARRYLRHLSSRPTCRFDILSVFPASGALEFTLRKGAFSWSTGRRHKSRFVELYESRFRRRP